MAAKSHKLRVSDGEFADSISVLEQEILLKVERNEEIL